MDLDDADRQFLESWTPPGSFILGYVGGIIWLDSEGHQRWRCISRADLPLTSVLGLLELCKLDMIARTDTGLPIRYEKDDSADE